MKTLKKILHLGIGSVLLFALASQAYAFKSQTLDIEKLITVGGTNSMWFSGKLVDKEEKVTANGLAYTVLTFDVDKVIKGQPASYKDPMYGTRLAKESEKSTVQVNIFGSSTSSTRIPDLGRELEIGSEGIFGFFGAGKRSFTSVIGGVTQGAFLKQSNGRLLNAANNINIKLANSRSENAEINRSIEALKAQQSSNDASVEQKLLEDTLSQLAASIYPQN